MSEQTALGLCEEQAAIYKGEADLWRAMAVALHQGYKALDDEDRRAVAVLLRRARLPANESAQRIEGE